MRDGLVGFKASQIYCTQSSNVKTIREVYQGSGERRSRRTNPDSNLRRTTTVHSRLPGLFQHDSRRALEGSAVRQSPLTCCTTISWQNSRARDCGRDRNWRCWVNVRPFLPSVVARVRQVASSRGRRHKVKFTTPACRPNFSCACRRRRRPRCPPTSSTA